jgi:hypothetical protein
MMKLPVDLVASKNNSTERVAILRNYEEVN